MGLSDARMYLISGDESKKSPEIIRWTRFVISQLSGRKSLAQAWAAGSNGAIIEIFS
jgi:N-acyl-L-homoserine lactone synthetase